MFVDSINLKNLRCFREADLKLQYPGRKNKGVSLEFPNINLLLGNNGSGKSTILSALALGTVAPVLAETSGLSLQGMVRRSRPGELNDPDREAEMTVEMLIHKEDIEGKAKAPNETITNVTRIKKKGDYERLLPDRTPENEIIWDGMYRDNSPAFLVVGYGTRRWAEPNPHYNIDATTKTRRLRYMRVASLFEDSYSLIPFDAALQQIQSLYPSHYDKAISVVNSMLPDEIHFTGLLEKDEYTFDFQGAPSSFRSLSDGYRIFLGWVGDLVYHLCRGCPPNLAIDKAPGLVLIDEIDLLLHPQWQREVIQGISGALPKLQFVFTSHSPIVAGSVQKENIFVMETEGDGTAIVSQYDERIYGLNAEQVLLSSYFGLRTTRSSSYVENELRPLSQKAMKGDTAATLKFMDKLASPVTKSLSEDDGRSRASAKIVDDKQFAELLKVYNTRKVKAPGKAPVKTGFRTRNLAESGATPAKAKTKTKGTALIEGRTYVKGKPKARASSSTGAIAPVKGRAKASTGSSLTQSGASAKAKPKIKASAPVKAKAVQRSRKK